MNARGYADALARLPEDAPADAVVAALTRALAAKGRTKLLPAILAELRAKEGRKLATKPVVEVAKESEKSKALTAAKSEGIEAAETVVNPALLSGWRARGKGLLVDRSGKKNLVDLYRKITS